MSATVIFQALPVELPHLYELANLEDVIEITAPPKNLRDEAVELRIHYAQHRPSDYVRLSVSSWRKLPYAYWLRGARALREAEPKLVERYWGHVLPTAIASNPRRAKRWLRPIFFTYCELFNPSDPEFIDFASRVRACLVAAVGAFAERMRENHKKVDFFAPELVPSRLSEVFTDPSRDFDESLERFQLWPAFVDTPIGAAAFSDASKTIARAKGDEAKQIRLMLWASRLSAPVSQTVHRVEVAEALLVPWSKSAPSDGLRARTIEFLISHKNYSDPRIESARHFRWRDISDAAVSVIFRWLTGDTLRGFIHLLEQTADEIWQYRKKFWMAYFDAGHIEEAWLALGPDAIRLAAQVRSDSRGLGFGRLEGAQSNQSVLLLKIGPLIFTEWSHNGSLRAYEEGTKRAPTLYQGSYSGAELREPVSLDFHDGANKRPQLPHMHSESGWWQRTARDFIRLRTGINLTDRAIL